METTMTRIEACLIRALEDTAAQHRSNTEVQIKALSSALDDLIAEQSRLQREAARRLAWLERLANADPERTGPELAALARLALRENVWPGTP